MEGLGIGDWGLGPIPNPQSPIPKYSNLNNLKNTILLSYLYCLFTFKLK